MIRRSSRYRRFLDWLFWSLLKGSRIRSGPIWFEVRYQCYYLSPAGRLYRITPEYDYFNDRPYMEIIVDLS